MADRHRAWYRTRRSTWSASHLTIRLALWLTMMSWHRNDVATHRHRHHPGCPAQPNPARQTARIPRCRLRAGWSSVVVWDGCVRRSPITAPIHAGAGGCSTRNSQRSWISEPTTRPNIAGEDLDFDPICSWPKQWPQPHPPIHFGGGTDSLGRIAKLAAGWLPNAAGVQQLSAIDAAAQPRP